MSKNKPVTHVARFNRLATLQPNGCWMWTGESGRDGYGAFRPGPGQPRYAAHRWSYEAFVGDIPEGMQIDHVCHTEDLSCLGGTDCQHRRCVNPSHLEAVTGSENTKRQRHYERSVTHCPKGHRYEEDNLLIRGDGKRRCRTCDIERKRVARHRERGSTTTTGG